MNLTVLTWALAKVQRSKYVGVAVKQLHINVLSLHLGQELNSKSALELRWKFGNR